MGVERVVLHCRCDERERAHLANEFVWTWDYRAWVFPNNPRRKMPWRAKFYLPEDRTDHSDEPYLFYDCPWCGNVLPGCNDVQADGAL